MWIGWIEAEVVSMRWTPVWRVLWYIRYIVSVWTLFHRSAPGSSHSVDSYRLGSSHRAL